MSDGEKRIAVRISKMMKGSDKRTRREESRESLTLQKTNKKIIIRLFLLLSFRINDGHD